MRPNTPETFWKKVDKTGDCWLWQGCLNQDGYGVVEYQGKTKGAHRVAWEITNGPIPAGLLICHKCDNRQCVRPDHHFLGLPVANTHDAMHKGRLATGAKHGSRTRPDRLLRGDKHPARKHPERLARGSKQGNAKLTDEQVRTIRRLYRSGNVTLKELAQQFGMSISPIHQIVTFQTWRHVTDAEQI